jgi:hypothetical protein
MGKDKDEKTKIEEGPIPTSSDQFRDVISRCLIAAFVDEDGKESIVVNIPPHEALAYLEKMKTELLMQRIGGIVAHGTRTIMEALIQAKVLTIPKGMPGTGGIIK